MKMMRDICRQKAKVRHPVYSASRNLFCNRSFWYQQLFVLDWNENIMIQSGFPLISDTLFITVLI